MSSPAYAPEQRLLVIDDCFAQGRIYDALAAAATALSDPQCQHGSWGPRFAMLKARALLELDQFAGAEHERQLAEERADPRADVVGWLELQVYDARLQREHGRETVFTLVDAEHALGLAKHLGAMDHARGRELRAELHLEKASLYQRARCVKLADREVAAAVAILGEQDGRVWLTRSALALERDDRLTARAALETALSCGNAVRREAHVATSHVRYLLGELDAAELALQPIFPFAPGDLTVRRSYLSLLMARERWPHAVGLQEEICAQIAGINPAFCSQPEPDADERYLLARLYERVGRFPEALAILDGLASDEHLGPRAQRMARCMRRPGAQQLPRKRLPAFPTVAQLRNHCGPASCELYMRFFGLEADQVEIARQIKEADGGTPTYKMRHYLMEAGFMTRRIEADLAVLKRLIDHGIPVIMEEEYSESLHVAIAVGYDDAREVL
ncbi:MAG: C39 family peptidase, partial [Myxococcales bacterium]|nr:C39 family peptidase [Myxococcales bacterium]